MSLWKWFGLYMTEWIVRWAQVRQEMKKYTQDLLFSLRMDEGKTEQATKRQRELLSYFFINLFYHYFLNEFSVVLQLIISLIYYEPYTVKLVGYEHVFQVFHCLVCFIICFMAISFTFLLCVLSHLYFFCDNCISFCYKVPV